MSQNIPKNKWEYMREWTAAKRATHYSENLEFREFIRTTFPQHKRAVAIRLASLGLSEIPGCRECGTPVKYFNGDFKIFCSCQCVADNNDRTGRVKEIHVKMKNTRIERYGVDHHWQLDSVKEQRKATWQTRYGVDNPFAAEEVKRKITDTMRERYGVDNPMELEETKKRIENTVMERYGVKHPLQSPEIITKVQKTNMERYGSVSVLARPEINQKGRDTIRELNNGYWGNQDPDTTDKLRDRDYLENLLQSHTVPELVPILGVSETTIYQYLSGHGIRASVRSTPQKEIVEFIRSIYDGEIVEDKFGIIGRKQLDIFIPELKLAIEYCGLYWHSEKAMQKGKNYHKSKLDECETRGIRLITIFDDEYTKNSPLVLSKIRHLMGFNKAPRIGARKLEIKTISSKTGRDFLDQHHIQGAGKASGYIGGFHDGALVVVLSFSEGRNLGRVKTEKMTEIIRYAVHQDFTVPGGFSRMLRRLEALTVFPIVTFADRRWSVGNVYERAGFTRIGNTPPNYWYLDRQYSIRTHRMAFQKHRLVAMFGDEWKSHTEWEIASQNGMDRIWDCGNVKFVHYRGSK